MPAPSTGRRDLLKKAVVGGAVAWTAPAIVSGVASAGAPVSGGCVVGAVAYTPPTCGPPEWIAEATLPFTGCAGAVIQLESINGVPQTSQCVALVTNPIMFSANSSVGPSVLTLVLTFRSACDGTILAGPIDVTLTSTSCPPPGAPVEPVEPAAGTVQLTVGDLTLEIPTGG